MKVIEGMRAKMAPNVMYCIVMYACQDGRHDF